LARCPRAGAVKTRLAATIGEAAALALYRAFLADQLAFLGSFSADHDREWCTDARPGPALAALAERAEVTVTAQGPGDLGARLAAVFARAETAGASATVVLGADSPTLPRRLVEESFACLAATAGAVVVPADDGGYALIGLVRPAPLLFDAVPWSGPQVLACTRERARVAGLPFVELERWYDVDDRAGLERLVDDLRRPGSALRAPHTDRAILDLSLDRMV